MPASTISTRRLSTATASPKTNLGRILKALKPANVIVGTKVRLRSEDLADVRGAVAASLDASLRSARHGPRRHPAPAQCRDGRRRRRVDLGAPGAGRCRAGLRGAASSRQDPLLRRHGGRRHGGAASGDRCRRLRQRPGRLQHAEPVGRQGRCARPARPGLCRAARSYARGGHRRGRHPRSRRRRAVGLGRPPSDRERAARADRLGRTPTRSMSSMRGACCRWSRRDMPRASPRRPCALPSAIQASARSWSAWPRRTSSGSRWPPCARARCRTRRCKRLAELQATRA